MKNWEFKNILVRVDGKLFFTELSEEQKKIIPDYIEALRTALSSDVPRPPFSNYLCKESIGSIDGLKLAAGNMEYGVCEAIHGETAAAAAFRSFYRRKGENQKLVLGIAADQLGEVPALCGDCRDLLLDEFGPYFEIVSGILDGGLATVINMRNYLFFDFERINGNCVNRTILGYFEKIRDHKKTKNIEHDVYSSNIHPERKYYVMIDTSIGEYFGALDVMCDYHPIYPLRDAIRQVRRENSSFAIKSVHILFENLKDGVLPHVMYRDRQHLLELNAQAEQFCQKEMNPPVFLFDSQGGQLVSMYKTTVKQWLPFAFVPQAFSNNFQK